MDKTVLDVLGVYSYCQICKNIKMVNGCEGCTGIISISDPKMDKPPSKFKSIYDVRREKKEMIVTIIGSMSKKDTMLKWKKYFERFGHEVNCPEDLHDIKRNLLTEQMLWIKRIEEADLVVAIPKSIKMVEDGTANFVYEFGESTSYEMAIASRFDKEIVIG